MYPQLRGLTNGGFHKRRIFGRYYREIIGFISLAVFEGPFIDAECGNLMRILRVAHVRVSGFAVSEVRYLSASGSGIHI